MSGKQKHLPLGLQVEGGLEKRVELGELDGGREKGGQWKRGVNERRGSVGVLGSIGEHPHLSCPEPLISEIKTLLTRESRSHEGLQKPHIYLLLFTITISLLQRLWAAYKMIKR